MSATPSGPDIVSGDVLLDEPYPDREWDQAPVLPALGLVLRGA